MGALLHQWLDMVVAPLVKDDELASELVADAIVRLMAQEQCFRTCSNACKASDEEHLDNIGSTVPNYPKRYRPARRP